jgi:Predicted acyltransferases
MRNKLGSLQILRGLAALSVVLFHYRFYMVPDKADMTLPNKLFGWGAIGVDLFFVISGFIMVYITYYKPAGFKSWKEFAISRLTRILPTYYILLLITFLISGAMSIFHYQDKTANLISALTFTPYLVSPGPFYIDPNGMYNTRWTLNYEIYFYTVFSLCLVLGKRILTLLGWVALTAIAGYTATGMFTLSAKGYETYSAAFNLLTNPIILEFIIGVFTGYAYFYLKDRSKNLKLATLVFSFIAIIAMLPQLKAHSLYTASISACLILVFSLFNSQITSFTPQVFVKMGDVSFSWYLLHNPFIHAVADRIEHIAPNIVRSGYGFIFFTIASFLVACLSHKYLEVLLSSKIKRWMFDKSKTVTT